MHEGAGEAGTAGASLGCIELAGADEWNRFLSALRVSAGVDSFAEIGRRRLLKVIIQSAAPPEAVYFQSLDLNTKEVFIEPTR